MPGAQNPWTVVSIRVWQNSLIVSGSQSRLLCTRSNSALRPRQCAMCIASQTRPSRLRSSLYGRAQTPSRVALVTESRLANRVTSTPRATSPSASSETTCSHGPYARGGVRHAIGPSNATFIRYLQASRAHHTRVSQDTSRVTLPRPGRPSAVDRGSSPPEIGAGTSTIPGDPLVFRENRVELALRLDEHVEGLSPLLVRAAEAHLAERVHDPEDRIAVVLRLRHRLVAILLPGRVFRRPLGLRPASLGEREPLASATLLGRDEAFVLEQLQRRVDRAGAAAPDAAGAALQLLDHLVSLHGPLDEQRPHAVSHVLAAA